MSLVYDNIVFAIQRCGGISVVWQELLQHQQNYDLLGAHYIDVDQNKYPNIHRQKISIDDNKIIRTIRYPKWERYFPVSVKSNNPFVFHSSYYRYSDNPHALNVTTVHDFTYELFFRGLKQYVHTKQKFSAIRHSEIVVCISENTKRDLLRLLPDVDERKVRVIYNGVSENYHLLKDEVSDSQLPFPSHSYVMFIGKRRDYYKNFELSLQAVASTKWNLLIVGSDLDEAELKMIGKYLPRERYHCVSHVKDEQLNLLYNHAAGLVYPSSYEGFGIPVLEAQRTGCPVIALEASSIPEVIGETPLLMKEPTEREMVNKMKMLSEDKLMQQVRAAGFVNANRFSWNRMGAEYCQLYQELLAGH